ncbi:jacalin-like lectin [Spirillospora albida]|uniref:jacalin-like lectin n=1 Tax=Spirillospora albida TaxID=58123 RepID=UPI0004C0E203|nr:jacalin-like lectin [Spirillospora albida]
MRRSPRILATAALVAAFPVLGPPPATADTPASGTFRALTYNIAGLPEGISSAPTPRRPATTAIGRRIGPFDLVNVQEDFNYHAYLYAADSHAHRTPTTGGAGLGSGLNSLSHQPFGDLDRITWNDCFIGSGDCLTPKGFTFHRVRLAEGAYLDVYNLHADAGSESGDEAARRANLAQLTSYIGTHSAGGAVLIMGDTNTRYTRTGDRIAQFAADNGLTDAWVRLARGGTAPAPGSPALTCPDTAPGIACEVVDKILYRSSRLLTLTATRYANLDADFRDGGGAKLSDHFPIAADFTWTRNPAYQASDQFGGPHGASFTDIDRVPAGARAATISLRAGSRVDQVGVTLDNGTSLTHGGTGGTADSLTLAAGEYVTSVRLCQGQKDGRTRIFHARFTTSHSRVLEGGTTTSDCVTRTAPAGWRLAGFHGRSGAEVDKLGFIYTAR